MNRLQRTLRWKAPEHGRAAARDRYAVEVKATVSNYLGMGNGSAPH